MLTASQMLTDECISSLPVQYRVNVDLAPFNDKLCFKDYISILLVFCLYNHVLIVCLPKWRTGFYFGLSILQRIVYIQQGGLWTSFLV